MDINQASREQLQDAFQVDSERAEHLVRKRGELGGFQDWEQFKELVPGFADQMVKNLQDAGFTLGDGQGRSGGSGQGSGQASRGPSSGQGGSARDACDLLELDHQRVEALFKDFGSAGSDRATKANLAQIICMELKVHTLLEEEIFYPAVRRSIGDDPLMQAAQEEHDAASELIDQIEAGGDLDQLLPALQTAIEEHVQEERQQMFPKARGAQDLDLRSLAGQIESRRTELIEMHQEA